MLSGLHYPEGGMQNVIKNCLIEPYENLWLLHTYLSTMYIKLPKTPLWPLTMRLEHAQVCVSYSLILDNAPKKDLN